MEVGAVKQAFNNEVILLKKNLKQAKMQIINKLTRNAKTLSEKKVPEAIKKKFDKKAESAVKEVLIIKKIKPRDIAKFIITHKGQLNQYLYRPNVDEEKACARLLLHKALQEKYKLIRERFSNISIDDLLMSRQERRKLKKEAKEKQKDKKKGKGNAPEQVRGDWDVEDVNMDSIKNNASDDDQADDNSDESESDSDNEQSGDENDLNNDDSNKDRVSPGDNLKTNDKNVIESKKNTTVDSKETSESNNDEESGEESNEKVDGSDGENSSFGTFVKSTTSLPNNDEIVNSKNSNNKVEKRDNSTVKKNVEKKHKDNHNKNRNLNTKILMKKFNKDTSELPAQETKVVDPFFITASGENYMSVAEPRQPDEVKEVHKEGNRKYRRAVMFGHVPKGKPRNNFGPDRSNARFPKYDDNKTNFKANSDDNRRNDFDKQEQKRFNKSDDSRNRGNFSKSDVNKSNVDEAKPEKLHPSWEAKKRQSGILPFEGKKIVFDEG